MICERSDNPTPSIDQLPYHVSSQTTKGASTRDPSPSKSGKSHISTCEVYVLPRFYLEASRIEHEMLSVSQNVCGALSATFTSSGGMGDAEGAIIQETLYRGSR